MNEEKNLQALAVALEEFIWEVYGNEETITSEDLNNDNLFSLAHTEMFEGSELNVYLNIEKLRIEKRPSIDKGEFEYVNFSNEYELIAYIRNFATFESLTELERDYELEV
ncbi:hypothetical protein NGH46_12490 [Staphylococcus xylosus]|uniref:hypothetical protein n=1 Tax=Staphylococcus xylosus TaxID=1288 RepID=UPI002DB7E13E|nr:hypothetical protein [Staphylococcus xylosus]MEB8122943.1 hypothetical protein [Staphylococcus xylosus]